MSITLDSLRERVPAIFTKTPSPKVSDRYSFADSEYYLQKFIDADWFIHSARQVSKSEYAPHQEGVRCLLNVTPVVAHPYATALKIAESHVKGERD